MHEFISTILNMSLTGSIVILVVLAARFIMRKLPKKYLYLLWGIVGLRLLCPVALESDLSIFNIAPIKDSVNTVKDLPIANYGGHVAVRTQSAAGAVSKAVESASSAAPVNYSVIVIALWAAVALGIAIYITRQYFLLRKNLKNVTELEPGLCVGHQIDSPFVMGLLKPVIYMPQGLADEEMRYLLLHEKTHIRRRDTVFKAIGLFTVALHWFNPLVWLAYKLFVQDMEMSCDEEVISELGSNAKADYSMSLVSFASRNHQPKYIVVPVTFSKTVFGGKEVKMRIKNILSYKDTSKLITTVSLVLVAAIGLVCLFNANTHADQPADGQQATAATTLSDEEAEQQAIADAQALAAAAIAQAQEEEQDKISDEEPAVVEEDNDVAEDEANTAASSAEVTYVKSKGFNMELPVIDSDRIFNKVDLGKGKHTTDKNPELAYSMGPDDSYKGRAFELRADKKVSDDLFNAQIKALEDMGFKKFRDEVDGTYFSFNKDLKIGVVVENIPGIYRISYFDMASTSDWNPFLCLG